MLSLHVCLFTTTLPGSPRGQKRALGTMELELWLAVSHLWVMGVEPKSSARV